MARARDPQPLNFIWLLLSVYIILFGVAWFAFTTGGWWVEKGYPYVSFGCMLFLTLSSVVLRMRQEVRLGTAAINVQAMGIVCLVLGLLLTVSSFGQGVNDMKRLSSTVGEALGFAALGICFAVGLKTLDDQKFASGKSGISSGSAAATATMAAIGIDPGAISDAFSALHKELKACRPEAQALRDELQNARVLMQEWGVLLEKLRKFFPAAGGGPGGV